MGMFDQIAKKFTPDKLEPEDSTAFQNAFCGKELVVSSSYRVVEDVVYGAGSSEYLAVFWGNDSFKEAKSHAGEVELLYTYAPFDT